MPGVGVRSEDGDVELQRVLRCESVNVRGGAGCGSERRRRDVDVRRCADDEVRK